MKIDTHIVMCLRCQHIFPTKLTHPRCSNCRSVVIKRVEDVPKLISVKDVQKLKSDFKAYKEYTTEVLTLLLSRIECIEATIKKGNP